MVLRMELRHKKTREAWNDPGHAHFLTYSCLQRLPLLNSDRTRRWVIDAMEQTRLELRVSLWAYVIMPEHVHVLLFPERKDYEMRRILASLKRSVSKRAREHLVATANTHWLGRLTVRYPGRRVFRFWQSGGGYDHNIFKERTVSAAIQYVHENPVRRGLVESPVEWPWSSARFWEGRTDVPIRMDDPFI